MFLKMRKPGVVASYLHRQLNQAESSEEVALQRQVTEDLEEIVAISGKGYFGTLPCWDPSGSVGTSLPVHNQPVVRPNRSARGRQSLVRTGMREVFVGRRGRRPLIHDDAL